MRIRKIPTSVPLSLDEDEIVLIAKISDALAHPARVRILRFITDKNRKLEIVYNKTVVEELGYAQATISQHLNTLVHAGLVESRKQEKFTCYYANVGKLGLYLNTLKKF